MAKRGDAARASVVETIQKAFADIGNLEGMADKKIYVWANDGEGGERIQYAITITAPKVPVTCGGTVSAPSSTKTSNEGAWSDTPSITVPAATPVSISEADRAKVQELMEKLGLPIES